MSRRTKVLFLFALTASLMLGVRVHNASLPCVASTVSFWAVASQSIMGHRGGETMFLYCVPVEPARLSTAIFVIALFVFGGAVAHSATLDIAEYVTTARSSTSI